MRVLSLFAGIGGFDLAAQWMGWATAAFVEWEEFPRQVLIQNFKCVPVEQLSAAELTAIISQWRTWTPGQPQPISVLYGDVCHFDARAWRGAIDLICGGFPCQPFSSAGAGGGVTDARHLWPQMLRIICEVRPLHVVGENVRGLLTKHPLQFEAVCAELEAQGYDVQPFLLPAAGVGAPHERYRFWFVAHAHGATEQARPCPGVGEGKSANTFTCAGDQTAADPNGAGREESYATGFAAQPGLGARCADACTTSDTTSLRCHKGQSGKLCQRGGQSAAPQRDSQRPALWTATDRRSEVPAHATGKCAECQGQCNQDFRTKSIRPASRASGCGNAPAAHTHGNQPGPISHLLRGESNLARGTAGHTPGQQGNGGATHSRLSRARQRKARRAGSSIGRAFRLTESPLRWPDDGVSVGLVRIAGNSKQARKLARRIEKLDAGAARNSLKAYGNSIVPQVAYRIFQAIDAVKALIL